MDEKKLLERIVINPAIFGGKPIIRDDGSQSSISSACWRQVIHLKPFSKAIPGWKRKTSAPA